MLVDLSLALLGRMQQQTATAHAGVPGQDAGDAGVSGGDPGRCFCRSTGRRPARTFAAAGEDVSRGGAWRWRTRSQATEQPTQRRLDKAREEGRFPVSREMVGAAQFLTFAMLLAGAGAAWCGGLMEPACAGCSAQAFHAEVTPRELERPCSTPSLLKHLAPLAAAGVGAAGGNHRRAAGDHPLRPRRQESDAAVQPAQLFYPGYANFRGRICRCLMQALVSAAGVRNGGLRSGEGQPGCR